MSRSATYLESHRRLHVDELGTNLDQSQRSEPLLILLRSGFMQTGAPFGGKTKRDATACRLAQSLTRVATNCAAITS